MEWGVSLKKRLAWSAARTGRVSGPQGRECGTCCYRVFMLMQWKTLRKDLVDIKFSYAIEELHEIFSST